LRKRERINRENIWKREPENKKRIMLKKLKNKGFRLYTIKKEMFRCS